MIFIKNRRTANDASRKYFALVVNMMIGNKIEKMINSNKNRLTIIDVKIII